MPRFVVLFHRMPTGSIPSTRRDHYDLMLEQGGTLWTWACEQMPAAGKSVRAQKLPDHRLDYLDYEGPVSGDRGSVMRVASGTHELVLVNDAEIRSRLLGESLRGELALMLGTEGNWTVSIEPDGA